MKKDSWTCSQCGSDNVLQEFSVLLEMNEDNGWEEGIENNYANDFYWCNDCDEECSPVRAYTNSLTPFYKDSRP